MIFEGKSLDDISDAEIAALVSDHVSERQHIEFKAAFDYRNDSARLEFLKDVASLANAGGGYAFIGIRDDGRGRAQRFDAELLKDPDAVAKSVRSLALDHIAERIDGLEVRVRLIDSNPVVAIRVPSSLRAPHMVTFHHGTHFYARFEDGKREMSIGTIRDMFTNDASAQQLARLEARLDVVVQRQDRTATASALEEALNRGSPAPLRGIKDGSAVADFQRTQFEREVGTTPFVWIAATPVLLPDRDLVNLDSDAVRSLILSAPGSRRKGWNMAGLGPSARERVDAFEIGIKEYEFLRVMENLHAEFWSPLDDHFCWRQSEDERRVRPRLYPYPVIEYPTSFLRLYRALLVTTAYDGQVLVQIQYRNVKGFIMRPGSPSSFDFDSPLFASEPYPQDNVLLGPVQVEASFDPDAVAFSLLRDQYLAFGIDPEEMPFRMSNGSFDFGK